MSKTSKEKRRNQERKLTRHPLVGGPPLSLILSSPVSRVLKRTVVRERLVSSGMVTIKESDPKKKTWGNMSNQEKMDVLMPRDIPFHDKRTEEGSCVHSD